MAPKPGPRTNVLHQRLLAGLIETQPVSRSYKVWNDEKKDVEVVKDTFDGLRYPLAQNVSALNIERAAKGWVK